LCRVGKRKKRCCIRKRRNEAADGWSEGREDRGRKFWKVVPWGGERWGVSLIIFVGRERRMTRCRSGGEDVTPFWGKEGGGRGDYFNLSQQQRGEMARQHPHKKLKR